MGLQSEAKKKAVQEFGRHDRDTGSSAVQITILSEQISHLTEHMKTHPKDFRSQRSLIIMVSRRQKHLNYLKRTDRGGYRKVVEKLGLRT